MLSLKDMKPPFVNFFQKAVEDRNASINAGRKITVDVDFVSVKQIGERDEVEKNAQEWLKNMREQATSSHGEPSRIPYAWFQHFEDKYNNWKKGLETPVTGTPVREWPVLSPAQVTNLHAMNTFTVEEIAAWTENGMGMYGMGGRELRDKARLWLESGDKKGEQIIALQVENETLKAQLSDILSEVKALREEVREDKPQRGRPRKEAEAVD